MAKVQVFKPHSEGRYNIAYDDGAPYLWDVAERRKVASGHVQVIEAIQGLCGPGGLAEITPCSEGGKIPATEIEEPKRSSWEALLNDEDI